MIASWFLLNSNRKLYVLYQMVMLPMTLRDPWNILRCFMHLTNWWLQRLQIWCTDWMCKLQPTDISPTQGAWLSFRDCFKILLFAVMHHVVRVCQRQLSYLSVRKMPLTNFIVPFGSWN